MLATASKKTRRFDSEISDLLFATVKQASSIFLFCPILLLLELLTSHIIKYRPEITNIKIHDFGAITLSETCK